MVEAESARKKDKQVEMTPLLPKKQSKVNDDDYQEAKTNDLK